MSENVLEQLTTTFGQYSLYDENIARFFRENYVYKTTFQAGEKFDILSRWSAGSNNTVAYVESGLLRIYLSNAYGEEVFGGFMPQASTLFPARSGAAMMGKYFIANTTTTVLFAAMQQYLQFLSAKPDLIRHQLEEPYYRRNLNDFPRYNNIRQADRLVVYSYVLFLLLSFGTPDRIDPLRYVFSNPPVNRDIASFCNVHPNNVSKFVNELVHAGLITRSRSRLEAPDIRALEQHVMHLKEEQENK